MYMAMGIEEVSDIIGKISDGFEEACANCMAENSGVVLVEISEQLLSGMDGEDAYLKPTYDDDPFFDEEGYWYHRSKDYKSWKLAITPPGRGMLLDLPPRPDEVPNLFIDGTFHSEINARRKGYELVIDPGNGNGPSIVGKYGQQILTLGSSAVEYFNVEYLLPAIDSFFKDCGYQ